MSPPLSHPVTRSPRPLRALAVLGALGAGSVALTACDASPYAATVGGQEISVNQLNHQLAGFAGDRSFVTYFDQNAQSNAEEEQEEGDSNAQAITVAGNGGPGTYSTGFADEILDYDIEVDAVHQYVAAKNVTVTNDELEASRAIWYSSTGFDFTSLPADLQDLFIQDYVDKGAITSAPTDLSSVEQAYSSISTYVFSSICVNQASAFSAQAAKQIIAAGTFTGTQVCYDQPELEMQSAAFRKAVLGLTTDGQISGMIPTSYGYQVVQLVSRSAPGLSPGVIQVLAAATADSETNVADIVTGAHVKVNPAYGTYSSSTGSVTAPQLPGSA